MDDLYDGIFYEVKIGKRLFRTEFSIKGYQEILQVIHLFGEKNLRYRVRVVNSKGEEVED